MQDSGNQPVVAVLSGETLLLWFAVAVALLFLGLLAYDLIRRRRRTSRQRRSQPEGWRQKLLKPFHRAQGLRRDLAQVLRERARRKRGQLPPPPKTPP